MAPVCFKLRRSWRRTSSNFRGVVILLPLRLHLLDLPIRTLHVGHNGDTGSDVFKCSDAFLLLPSWNVETGRTSTSAALYFPSSRMKFRPGSFSEEP